MDGGRATTEVTSGSAAEPAAHARPFPCGRFQPAARSSILEFLADCWALTVGSCGATAFPIRPNWEVCGPQALMLPSTEDSADSEGAFRRTLPPSQRDADAGVPTPRLNIAQR